MKKILILLILLVIGSFGFLQTRKTADFSHGIEIPVATGEEHTGQQPGDLSDEIDSLASSVHKLSNELKAEEAKGAPIEGQSAPVKAKPRAKRQAEKH